MTEDSRRPVTVLSGFLGSGKTTLLRRYLALHRRGGIAVIINEYGAVGVDHHLVRMVEEKSVLLGGGCVCCSRRVDLVRTLRELLDLEETGALPPLEQVVIETSGIADPVPVLFTLATEPMLKHQFVAASVVVTLDALTAAGEIERHPEVRKQIIAADRVVVTKADLAARDAIAACRMRVSALNPTADITLSFLGDGCEVLAPAARPDHAVTLPPGADPGPAPPHPEVQSTALGFSGPLDWPAFTVWLGMLLEAHGPDVLRVKGLLDIGDAGPVVMNVAQHVVHPPEHLRAWPAGTDRPYLVFITRGIDPASIPQSFAVFQRAAGRLDLSITGLA